MVDDVIVKLLMLSTSPNDHEALSAIRNANVILRKKNITWYDVFKNQVRSDPIDELFRHAKEKNQEIDSMLAHCLEFCNEKIRPFIQSLAESKAKYKRLTPKQEAALRKIYGKIA